MRLAVLLMCQSIPQEATRASQQQDVLLTLALIRRSAMKPDVRVPAAIAAQGSTYNGD